MGVAIFNNMAAPDPAAVKDGFVVGIVDDVGFSHLSAGGELEDAVPEGTTECMFWCASGRGWFFLCRVEMWLQGPQAADQTVWRRSRPTPRQHGL
jgi:hypothetical protein